MLGMAVAAVSFAACNKQETTPVVNEIGNKSIVMSIANVQAPTKSAGTSIDDEKTQVTLNNYQVFFSDGKILYTPMNATASAEDQTYFVVNANTGEDKDFDHQFHFLDNNVTRVIVVGNLNEAFPVENGKTTEDDLWASFQNLKIKDQQEDNIDNLILYGSDSELKTTEEHNSYEDQHPKPVYKAVVNLMPAVARFEVTGYQYNEDEDAEYASVAINNQSLIGFYESAVIYSEGENDWSVTPDDMHAFGWDATANDGKGAYVTYTWDNVYQDYFSELTPEDKAAWYYDNVGVTLTPSDTPTAAAPSKTQDCYAYSVFPDAVPSFIFQITATDEAGIVTPMYLQTKGFTEIDKVAAGNVYQMNVKFDDTVLKAAEKCIDVEITVHDWVVTVVTPEF